MKKDTKKNYPRIIFPLNKLYCINPLIYDKFYYKSEIEMDGCFYITNGNFTMEKNEFPFQSQYCKIFSIYFDKNNNIENEYQFLKNDLCLIKVKTHFPEKNPYHQNEKNFSQTIYDMLENMMIFVQLFQDLKLEFNRIRLILFYDLVRKKIMKRHYIKFLQNFLMILKISNIMTRFIFK